MLVPSPASVDRRVAWATPCLASSAWCAARLGVKSVALLCWYALNVVLRGKVSERARKREIRAARGE